METEVRLFIPVILMLGLLSCKKFDHSEVQATSCALCSYAKSVEGTYRGEVSNLYQQTDSVTVTIEQIFKGNSLLEDSTIMLFDVTMVYDSLNSYGAANRHDTIRINNLNGENMDHAINGAHWLKQMDPQFILVEDAFYSAFSDVYCLACGNLERQ